MNKIEVRHLGGDRFVAHMRGHEVRMDQPVDDGGTDLGPSPTEIFVTGLVGCIAHYARRFLDRHGIDPEGLRVSADWTLATDRPARVGAVRIVVDPPPSLPEARREAFLAIATHCTVHNSLRQPPEIEVVLDGEQR
jgi:uncharacterized OsmC-like protein